ncbi:MAG: tannase/feruloyl esterase family alpha/beta hydrolase [Gammaproteobacteria bacterium]|nr:tannase/feruloyl esterase family alpha/beta hydrolase [Gammaproteobacteria bacterium]
MSVTRSFRLAIFAAGWALLFGAVAQGQPPAPGPQAVPPTPLIPNARPVRSCESLAEISLPDTTIESAVVEGNVCRVTAFTTHPPSNDRVTIWVAIPLTGWNGRFLGNGGGGFSGGSANAVNQPVTLGYAAGATDTGHEGGSGSFALNPDGRLNWQLIRDNAHVGIHEMTVTGKALTEALYGEPPRYSYFSGCSTGGRQALMEAQRYPLDYDGIVAGAPAINWTKLHMQQLWGPLQMNIENHPVAPCKLAAATAAAIAQCDMIDGVEDGILENPAACYYDPHALVGTTSGDCGTFMAADADMIQRLWLGPRRQDGRFLWFGMPPGADLSALSGSRGDPLQPQAMSITLDWFRYFLTQDPEFDWTSLTHSGYERLWDQSVEQYAMVIATDYAILNAFRDRGGKAILWHGWADQLITAYGTLDYYERVITVMGGEKDAAEFIRLFMAPGVAHCAGGNGPAPSGQLEALLAWVEEDEAPEMLPATLRDQNGQVIRTRPLCPFPLVARYRGRGSTDEAENFECNDGF